MSTTARPGIALKNLRRQNHWTLADVSRRTGVPASTLSRIENDQISPTFDLLLRLSQGLAIDLAQLLSMGKPAAVAGSGQSGRRSVNRHDAGSVVRMPGCVLHYLSTDLLNKQMSPVVSEYSAGSLAEFGELMTHPGEEFLYVLDGELELHTECYSPVVLGVGESIYFDSSMGHAYVARGGRPCRALSISTVPEPSSRSRKLPVKPKIRRPA